MCLEGVNGTLIWRMRTNTETRTGYFVYNHEGLAGSRDLFAQLWKEYALSDSRYLTSDPFMLCVETITVVCGISFLRPLRLSFVILIQITRSYGDLSASLLRSLSPATAAYAIPSRSSRVWHICTALRCTIRRVMSMKITEALYIAGQSPNTTGFIMSDSICHGWSSLQVCRTTVQ